MRLSEFTSHDILNERVSDTLYHYTTVWAADQILTQGYFELSSTLGTDIEQQFAPPGYRYFLSATRSLTGGYHDYVGSQAVMMVLDGSWFNARYPGRAVDYWQNRDPLRGHHRAHEAEDRIFSREPRIPIGGIKSVHVLVTADAEPPQRAWARQLLIAAKRRRIPAYLYSDTQAWRRLDTRHRAPLSSLTGPEAQGARLWRHRGYLMPWLELLYGVDKKRLSQNAAQRLYSLTWGGITANSATGLKTDLSNARKPNSGADREHAIKIEKYMRRHGITSIEDLLRHIAQRWKPKNENT